jgi:hypothetical protein
MGLQTLLWVLRTRNHASSRVESACRSAGHMEVCLRVRRSASLNGPRVSPGQQDFHGVRTCRLEEHTGDLDRAGECVDLLRLEGVALVKIGDRAQLARHVGRGRSFEGRCSSSGCRPDCRGPRGRPCRSDEQEGSSWNGPTRPQGADSGARGPWVNEPRKSNPTRKRPWPKIAAPFPRAPRSSARP